MTKCVEFFLVVRQPEKTSSALDNANLDAARPRRMNGEQKFSKLNLA